MIFTSVAWVIDFLGTRHTVYFTRHTLIDFTFWSVVSSGYVDSGIVTSRRHILWRHFDRLSLECGLMYYMGRTNDKAKQLNANHTHVFLRIVIQTKYDASPQRRSCDLSKWNRVTILCWRICWIERLLFCYETMDASNRFCALVAGQFLSMLLNSFHQSMQSMHLKFTSGEWSSQEWLSNRPAVISSQTSGAVSMRHCNLRQPVVPGWQT